MIFYEFSILDFSFTLHPFVDCGKIDGHETFLTPAAILM